MGGGIVPNKNQDAINFFTTRLPSWAVSPTSIGLSMPIVTELASLANAAQSALSAANAARVASKNATVALNEAMAAMRRLGGDAVITIRAYAETTNNPAVYTIASIPPVAPPTPLGPAETPTNVLSRLTTGGSVQVTWKGSRRGGTSFNIERRLTQPGGSPGQWSLIGTSEDSKFTDASVPVGQASATYRVIAQRSGGSSEPSDVTTVYFGSGNQEQSVPAKKDLTIAA